MAIEMLRGVYPERSACAQHDRAVFLPRQRHRRAFRLLPLLTLQQVLGFSSFDALLSLGMSYRPSG